jgi:Fe(3+) dicitrate transport protein
MKKTAILIAFLSSNAIADDLAPLSIFGGQAESEIAGSATYIGDDELKKSGYTDTERIMGRVPGVFSQTEDGLGLRTNIGMRGTNPNRTTKINITEDGILQGPAVYSNPSMYFYPDAGDAEGIEVLKGAASIGNGPRTTAGAINYLSRSVPTDGSKGYFNQSFGDESYLRNHFYYGGTMGDLSYVFETHKTSYDGHKEIDVGAGNDTNSGFRKNSDLFKIRYTMPSSYMELSSQNTSETSHASYIGLTRADFAANENRRYGISSKDKMDNDYHRYIFTYGMDISPTSNLVAKVYKAKYSRNWKKVGEITVDADGVEGGATEDVGLGDIDWQTDCAADSTYELRACRIITNGLAMDLTGESIKRSLGHRDYGMYGYDIRYNTILGAHDITIGYRQHSDYRDRHDSGISETYTLGSNNTMAMTAFDYDKSFGAGMSGGVSGNDDYASARSISISDRITHGNFVTTLGLRHEDVDYWEYTAGTHGKKTETDNSQTMLAASTVMNMGNGKSAFLAYSQGYQPTGVSTQEPEESDNYEIGYRSNSANSNMEIIGFHVDYERLYETCNIAAGCVNSSNIAKNAGEAHVTGVEFVYQVNNLFAAPQMKGAANTGSGARYPMVVSVTVQEAEHDFTSGTSFADGARIAYTPEEIYYVSLGKVTNSYDMQISAKYNDEVFNKGVSTAAKTESAWIYDFRSGMDLSSMGYSGARAYLNIDNLFDKQYIASTHNYGVRANKPQTIMAGISLDF